MSLIQCAIIRPGEVNNKLGQKIPFQIRPLECVCDPETDHGWMEGWGIQVFNAHSYFLLISGTESRRRKQKTSKAGYYILSNNPNIRYQGKSPDPLQHLIIRKLEEF